MKIIVMHVADVLFIKHELPEVKKTMPGLGRGPGKMTCIDLAKQMDEVKPLIMCSAYLTPVLVFKLATY
jgi:hypothetical protein